MTYELAPLKSYVGFYLAVRKQLVAAWDTLLRTHKAMGESLGPFSANLAVVQSAGLAAAVTEPSPPPPAIAALWIPEDSDGLGGINDIYEVVGRFSFQGDDNANLQRVQLLVSTARNEVHSQKTRLTDLAGLSTQGKIAADKLEADILRKADQAKAEKLVQFAPLAQAAIHRAKQTVTAVREVPMPELDKVEIAADEYRRYASKVDQVYKTCLPFLKKALGALCEFAQCEITATWPESLPLVHEMPAELIAVPNADSYQLQTAQTQLSQLSEEETLLNRSKDDVALSITRLEGEVAALRLKDKEFDSELNPAKNILEYATANEQLEALKQSLASLEQQKAQRVYVIGELWQRVQQTEAAIKALDEELVNRYQEMSQKSEQLNREIEEEPRLFGKEDWRVRVAVMQAELEGLKAKYTERVNLLNQLKMDLRTLSVQAQTEQSQAETLDRWVTDTKAKQTKQTDLVKEIEKKLGAAKPPRAPKVIEAQELLAVVLAKKQENTERIERYEADKRRQEEDLERVVARFKQIETERQRADGTLHDAQVAATQGLEAALKQLAARRRTAVEQHVTEVLNSLESSMNSVELMFVEPAKNALLASVAANLDAAVAVRETSEKVGPVVETLNRELMPELLALDAALGQIQREFCDAAIEACHSAWA